MDHDERFIRCQPTPLGNPRHDMDYHTSFERKKRRAGLPIYQGNWRRHGRT
jgi:tRNA (guanine-N7-)-methyltransferase